MRSSSSNEDIMKLTSPVKLNDGVKSKPIPVDKKCRVCKMRKLLAEFEINDKARDKRATICKTCMEERKRETECDQSGHTDVCIKNKFLIGVFNQLDCLLAFVESGMTVPDDILDIMHEIMEQDGATRMSSKL
jgi:CBS domain-containing protein